MLFRNPRIFAFTLIAIGVGLCTYYGEARYRLHDWSAMEIEQSVELNLALDLRRLGPHLQPSGERLEQLRQQVRAEVEAEIRRERETLERWIGVGLLLTVLGIGRWIYSLLGSPN